MPMLERYGVSLHYEEYGSGYPILLLAPGAFDSAIDWWERSPINPITLLQSDYRLIAMDQRNAGQSRALITATDGWHSFTDDHLALLDYLGIQQCHVLGQCIGVSFALRLIQVQPWRISAAALLQPIGTLVNPPQPSDGFGRWRAALTGHPEATEEVLDGFQRNLYTYDFVYNVSRDFVASCQAPLLVLAGNDKPHPFPIAEEIARLAPNAEFIPEWKQGELLEVATKRIQEFLASHTPVSQAT
jgi:pimeloyl-ACP methyl ester carboxylesterase